MHGFNFSVPLFSTCIRGMRIVVTPQLVVDVLHVLRVEHLDYPGCERLRIVSKDEMIFAFCERLDDWGAIIILHHVRPLLNFLDS